MKYDLTMYFYDSEGFEQSSKTTIEASCNTEAVNKAEAEAKKLRAIYYNVEKA